MAPMNNPETAVVPPALTEPDADSDELVAEDLLVEEISIDGMCGVY
jgi:mycofactocin precursor